MAVTAAVDEKLRSTEDAVVVAITAADTTKKAGIDGGIPKDMAATDADKAPNVYIWGLPKYRNRSCLRWCGFGNCRHRKGEGSLKVKRDLINPRHLPSRAVVADIKFTWPAEHLKQTSLGEHPDQNVVC